MSIDTVFLTRTEVGLVHWDEFRKPPYSVQDYTDAYNNGVKMVAAILAANADGASKVVLERGNYPTIYANKGTGGDTIRESHTTIKGTTNLTIDGNSSCIFTIFDSNVRNPYHTNTKYLPHRLPGQQFLLEDNTNLTIKGFDLRGDQYNRSWVENERFTEQTYGIYVGKNNINTKIDIIGRGFRGDAISGSTKGSGIAALTNSWVSGGVDTSTGQDIVEVGSYRTGLISLDGATIYRNALQLESGGYLRSIEFREDRFNIFFYDSAGELISYESSHQCEFIYLPVDCTAVQLVAYGDERTTETVSYGTGIALMSGGSQHILIHGEYYANHRGAISNLCGYTTVDADIHDNGTLKYGFPHYDDLTRYGINFEDTYSNTLTVRGKISNGVQGILYNGRTLNIDKCEIKNISTAAIGLYNSTNAVISDSYMENIEYNSVFLSDSSTINNKKLSVFKVNNCTFRNVNFEFRDPAGLFIGLFEVKSNTFIQSKVVLEGNNKNLVFDNNNVLSTNTQHVATAFVKGALRVTDNVFMVNRSAKYPGWQGVGISGAVSNNNTIFTDVNPIRFGDWLGKESLSVSLDIKGLDLCNSYETELYTSLKGVDDTPNIINIENCKFKDRGALAIGSPVSHPRVANNKVAISDTYFGGGDSLNIKSSLLGIIIRETESTGEHEYIIKNCTFDVTYAQYLLNVVYGINGKLDIKFVNCTFMSDTPKRLRFIYCYYGLANITARAIGCEFINVVNGK